MKDPFLSSSILVVNNYKNNYNKNNDIKNNSKNNISNDNDNDKNNIIRKRIIMFQECALSFENLSCNFSINTSGTV